MAKNDIHIHLDIPVIEMPHIRDVELMRAFIRAGYHMEELATINHCRMHVWVIFLSDICTGAGEQVNQQWLRGKSAIHMTSTPGHKWATQALVSGQCGIEQSTWHLT